MDSAISELCYKGIGGKFYKGIETDPSFCIQPLQILPVKIKENFKMNLLENVHLLQNVHLCTQNSVYATLYSDLFEK